MGRGQRASWSGLMISDSAGHPARRRVPRAMWKLTKPRGWRKPERSLSAGRRRRERCPTEVDVLLRTTSPCSKPCTLSAPSKPWPAASSGASVRLSLSCWASTHRTGKGQGRREGSVRGRRPSASRDASSREPPAISPRRLCCPALDAARRHSAPETTQRQTNPSPKRHGVTRV